MVHGNNSVLFNKGGTGENCPLRAWIDCIGKVAPMNKILTDRMAPMLTPVFWRVGLVKEVPVALPKTQSIRVIQFTLRTYKMIERPITV